LSPNIRKPNPASVGTELEKALAAARLHRVPLIVAKVDRLTRSAHFLSQLLEAGVDALFCDLPKIERPTGRFLLRQMASEGGPECSPLISLVPITWTVCHFGGRRPWFVCPLCGRRSAVIYMAGEHVACRRCFGLVYASQQEPVRQRGLMKAQKIRTRLGGSPSLMGKFPDRPKGMHEKTFQGLRSAHDRAAERCMAGLSRFLTR
jgi:hypothetical protein